MNKANGVHGCIAVYSRNVVDYVEVLKFEELDVLLGVGLQWNQSHVDRHDDGLSQFVDRRFVFTDRLEEGRPREEDILHDVLEATTNSNYSIFSVRRVLRLCYQLGAYKSLKQIQNNLDRAHPTHPPLCTFCFGNPSLTSIENSNNNNDFINF